jgi:vacuolar-type H+-ATPase subunit H
MKNMLSSACLNIVGVNPFDVNNRNEDYLQLIKLMRQFDTTWDVLPIEEKYILVENIFNHIFKIILVSFKYLPGHVFSSTLYQITNFSTIMGQLHHPVLSDKEIFQLGKMARKIDNMRKLYKRSNISKLRQSINKQNWVEEFDTLNNVVQGLMDHGSVYWIILVDNIGNELISKFGSNASTKNKNLLSMAMSGVQSLVSEITETSINQIDQEKTSILIEKRKLFSLIMLVQKPVRHKFQQVLNEIADYIEENLDKAIEQFKGKLNVFKDLEIYLEEKMKDLMI